MHRNSLLFLMTIHQSAMAAASSMEIGHRVWHYMYWIIDPRRPPAQVIRNTQRVETSDPANGRDDFFSIPRTQRDGLADCDSNLLIQVGEQINARVKLLGRILGCHHDRNLGRIHPVSRNAGPSFFFARRPGQDRPSM
jgi:hypothetical protein